MKHFRTIKVKNRLENLLSEAKLFFVVTHLATEDYF